MPFYEFKCKECEYVHEELLTFAEREAFPKENRCSCGGELWQKFATIARHSSWESTGKYGVNGTYNRGLGCVVYSDADMRQKAKAKGLIPYGDAYDASNWHSHTDYVMDKETKRLEQHERTIVKYNEAVEKHGNTEEGRGLAGAEVFTEQQMKDSGALTKKSLIKRDNTPEEGK